MPAVSAIRRSVACLLVAASVAACGGHDGSSAVDATSTTRSRSAQRVQATTTTVDPTATFAAGIAQYREDEITHVIQVELENLTAEPLRIRGVQLRWDGLEEVAPSDPDYTLFPHVIAALTADYGAGRCASDGTPTPPEGAIVHVVGVRPDGTNLEADVPVTRQLRTLERVQAAECEQQLVASVADISFDPQWVPSTLDDGRPSADGTLRLQRRSGDQEVVVTQIDGLGVLLDVGAAPPGATPVATLGAHEQTASGPVVATGAERCSAHALGEDKKTYEMSALVEIDREPHRFGLSIPPEARPTLHDVINRTCGITGG
jgi:hypothetical protein